MHFMFFFSKYHYQAWMRLSLKKTLLNNTVWQNKLKQLERYITRGDVKAIVLPIFCSKLFGDLGQELLAVAKNYVFTANDRPSAARYILMKLSKSGEGGGGGYFPNKNPFFI